MSRKLDLHGQVYGRLTPFRDAGSEWVCACVCGKIIVARTRDLRSGNTRSCGCLKNDGIAGRSITHGRTNSPEYRAWRHIKSRCLNPNVWNFYNYGGRGIKVCDRWMDSFDNFYFDMGPRPSSSHSIDRYPNVNGNYEPGNCRWATDTEQARGQRTNHWLEYEGVKMILSDWAVELKTWPSNINKKLQKMPFVEVVKYYKSKI